MGIFIDSNKGYETFKLIYNNKYFVDKSNIIQEFNKLLNDSMNCVCITKPRRFGKSSIAALIISYYSKSRKDEFKKIFDTLEISGNEIAIHNKLSNQSNSSNNQNTEFERKGKEYKITQVNISELDKRKKEYEKTMGEYNTIYIDISEEIKRYIDVYQYLSSLEKEIISELKNKFKDYEVDSLNKYLNLLYDETHQKFIFVIDEWDCMFIENLFTIEQRKYYLSFLRSLFKGQPYVAFAYMTGILPIAKSTSGTSLNNFREYTMLQDKIFYKYFGFTEKEVRNLCKINGHLKYEDMENWYNGYKSYDGKIIFNTWSIMNALRDNSIDNYWTESGSKKEIKENINFNFKGVKEDFLKLITRKKIKIKLTGYGAEDEQNKYENGNQEQNNLSQNEILDIDFKKNKMYSKMVVYGLLTYCQEEIFIPNNELHEKFIELIYERNEFEEFKNLIKKSEDLLNATLEKNIVSVCRILKNFHMDNTPLKNYYTNIALTSMIYFAYYYARNKYYVTPDEEGEDGVTNLIFIPKNDKKNDIAIIIELKVGKSARDAIDQIYDGEYYTKLFNNGYKGDILLVGINIVKSKKTYTCIIEDFDKKKIKKINNNTCIDNNNNNNDKKKRKRKQNKTNKINQMEYQTEYKKKLRSYNK